MKAVAILLGSLLVGGAFGQSGTQAGSQAGAPADVPKDHWAFSAVDNLFRAGILKGYPDGTFKGSRPASRFELATMLGAFHSDVEKRTRDLQESLRSAKGGDTSQLASKSDADALRKQLESIRLQVEAMRTHRQDIDGLNSTLRDLQEQLEKIRSNLAGVRQDLDRTRDRTKGH